MRSLWDRLFKNDLRLAIRELVRCKSFVRVAIHNSGSAAPIYNVTEFDFKNYRMNYFEAGRDGNFSMPMPEPSAVEFIDAGNHSVLFYNHEFNRKLLRLWQQMESNREELRDKRIFVGNCAHTNNPIYLTNSGQFHKLRHEEKGRWPAELCFKYMTLYQQAPGIEHYYAFGYDATRGSSSIIPNVSASWEKDPWYVDIQAEREAKLVQEYNEYLKADHFQNGDLIQTGSNYPEVFIRYCDEDRTEMMVYPSGRVVGIRKILGYKLIQRNYRPDLATEDPVTSN